ETEPAVIEAHESIGARGPLVDGAERRHLPLALDVRRRQAQVHEGGSIADRPERDAHAVARPGVADTRLHESIVRRESRRGAREPETGPTGGDPCGGLPS